MASTAREDTGQSSSAASDGSLRQHPMAAALEADSQCPICLGPMKRPAYVTYCMHKFCFRCILQWARARDNCPVCRQPMQQLLYAVRGDSDYKEFNVIPIYKRGTRKWNKMEWNAMEGREDSLGGGDLQFSCSPTISPLEG
uniref:RING-type E3 ubiquitin transferase n=1 Tax=Malurus cyaneus samueli TaxID=2593467 RepID=A0A8C5UJP8_9PASS